MSDALDQVKGITQLPLFPLPLVLLPIELLPLHIFEPRYRKMLEDVTATNNLFGVTLFDAKDEFDSRPPLGTIGCTALIREVHTMPDGRSNLIANGLIRFRIVSYVESEAPYEIAEVEFFEDEQEDPGKTVKAADDVFELFQRIAHAAFKMSGSRGRFPEIERTDPEPMSFLVTAAFNLENDKKYRLLEMTSTVKRLKSLKKILSQAVDRMEASAEVHEVSRTNGHSNTKLDL